MTATLVAQAIAGGHGHRTLFDSLDLTVAPGDVVTLNQNVAEVETAKAIVELPSPYAGTVSALHADAGETIAVGAPLIGIGSDGRRTRRQCGSVSIERRCSDRRSDMIPVAGLRPVAGGGCARCDRRRRDGR